MSYVGIGVGRRWDRAFLRRAPTRPPGYVTQINPDEVESVASVRDRVRSPEPAAGSTGRSRHVDGATEGNEAGGRG